MDEIRRAPNKINWDDLPPLSTGDERQWVFCNSCGWTGYYDYLPYSLSNPIMTLGCGHMFHQNITRISEEAARLATQLPVLPKEISAAGVVWALMDRNSLPGFHEDVGTLHLGTEEKPRDWRVGKAVVGAALYLFTDIKHPDIKDGGRTLVGTNATYVLNLATAVQQGAAEILKHMEDPE